LLDDPLPKILYPSLPYVWFYPVNKIEKVPENYYDCPVYITSKRAGELLTSGQSLNFIIHISKKIKLILKFKIVDLPFDDKKYDKNHWVKRGAALLCSLSE
jgi:dynein heavy chain